MVFLLLPVLFLTIAPNFIDPFELLKSLLLPCWLLIYLISRPKILSKPPKIAMLFALIPLGYVASALVNKQNPILAALGSYNRNMGIMTLFSMLAILILFSTEKSQGEKFIKYGIQPLVVMSCLLGSLELFGLNPFTSKTDRRIILFTGNSNFAAAIFAILLTASLFMTLQAKKRESKALNVILMFIICLLGLRTGSAQFFVIGVISLTSFLLFNFGKTLNKINGKKKVLSLVILLGIFLTVLVKSWTFISRITNFNDRLASWKIGLEIFQNHRFFGVGVEQFWKFQGIYKSPEQQKILGNQVIVDKSHNVFIDHLANGGLITGLPFLLFIVSSIFLLYKVNRLSLEKSARLKFALFASIWCGYTSQLFFSPDSIFLMTLGFSSLALVIGIMSSESGNLTSSRKAFLPRGVIVTRIAAIILLLPMIMLSYRAISSEVNLHKAATNQLSDGNKILESIRSFPNPKGTEVVIVQALKNAENCPFANAASDELLKQDSRSSQAWYFKTLCSDQIGKYSEALKYVDKSLQFQPLNLLYLEARFRLEIRTNDLPSANVTLQKLINVDPLSPKLRDLKKLIENS